MDIPEFLKNIVRDANQKEPGIDSGASHQLNQEPLTVEVPSSDEEEQKKDPQEERLWTAKGYPPPKIWIPQGSPQILKTFVQFYAW